ncbi:hypothetical protein [Sporolactobacillus spathodeae]|uniref:DNA-binding CsgD family transcriptional regulator n=1 Tax=Sporolactobacillus spathodeae TaxID=1465502 RepID=A0ABS2QAA5_9BACL|nr:hypothetical protein [Sporolactobacillus spathodeae]MBM7658104.1 DNA-binding CsgD family transcriptional regulator [Sporolactobacillus spathodeae]
MKYSEIAFPEICQNGAVYDFLYKRYQKLFYGLIVKRFQNYDFLFEFDIHCMYQQARETLHIVDDIFQVDMQSDPKKAESAFRKYLRKLAGIAMDIYIEKRSETRGQIIHERRVSPTCLPVRLINHKRDGVAMKSMLSPVEYECYHLTRTFKMSEQEAAVFLGITLEKVQARKERISKKIAWEWMQLYLDEDE